MRLSVVKVDGASDLAVVTHNHSLLVTAGGLARSSTSCASVLTPCTGPI